MKPKFVLSILLAVAIAAGTLAAFAADATEDSVLETDLEADAVHDVEHVRYRVRITNLTKGQPFSQIVLATHRPGLRWFRLGAEAPRPLVELAENGDPRPLAAVFHRADGVRDVAVTSGPLAPGESVVISLAAGGPHTRLSLAGMMTETNDGFFALHGAGGPVRRGVRAHISPGFDAGSEANDELCDSVPGPSCGGEGGMDGEGFIHVHAGIHGIGDLEPARHDFRNPVARIQIDRVLVPSE